VRYAARSKDEEAGRDSTGDQLRELDAWIEAEPERFAYGEPQADHASGYRGDRGPGLEAAIAIASQAKAEHGRAELLAVKSERFARGSGREAEARSLMELYVEMRRQGIALRSVHDDAFLDNPMLVGVADVMANKYSEDLSAHVRRGLASRARQGRPPSSPAYGYRRSGEGAAMTWEPNPAEAAIARRIYREFAEHGRSFSGIAKTLNAEGVHARKGGNWAPRVIAQLLKSRHVLGEFRSGDDWQRGDFPGIVEPELWQAAQAQLDRNAKFRPGRSAGRLPKAHLFVRGSLRCGKCGEAMLPRSVGERETYACRTRTETHGPEGCDMPVLPRAAVDSAALALFEARCLDLDATRASIEAQISERVEVARAEAGRAAGEAARAQASLDRADRDYREGELGPKGYERQLTQCTEALKAARAEHERLGEQAERLQAALSSLDSESEVLRRLAALRKAVEGRIAAAGEDVEALRAALAAVFEATLISEIGGDLVLEPHLRPEFAHDLVFRQGASPKRRIGLGLNASPSAENNESATHVLDQITTSRA
jgi:DNA invertase Pin-like site-specific DNA recombinase